jgi:septum site-determining protein MinC
MDAPRINVKGIRDGLLISPEGDLSTAAYHTLRQSLQAELTAKRNFLRGSRVALSLGSRALTAAQLADLHTLLAELELELWAALTDNDATRDAARQVGLATRLPGSATDLDGNNLAKAGMMGETAVANPPPSAANSLLLRETLRSGRSIQHEGHIIILGDVNPGAEIIAGGDVIVWGKLRGLVHAGADGNNAAVICALDLSPTQLRIANQIAVSPPGQRRKPTPETAVIRDGQIVAEPWR